MANPPSDQTTITQTATQLRDGNGYAAPHVGSYTNLTGTGTTTIKTGNGFLYGLTINNPTATGTITLYDNTSGSGTKIGTITVPTSPQPVTLRYNVNFLIGLTIVVATASQDITVTWR